MFAGPASDVTGIRQYYPNPGSATPTVVPGPKHSIWQAAPAPSATAPQSSSPSWMTPASPSSNPLDLKPRQTQPVTPGTRTTPTPTQAPKPSTPTPKPSTPAAAAAPRTAGGGSPKLGRISPKAGAGIGAAAAGIGGAINAAQRIGAGQDAGSAAAAGAITAGGALAGGAAGAAVGGIVGGPLGAAIGGQLGGALGGVLGGALADKLYPLPEPTGGNGTGAWTDPGAPAAIVGGQSPGVVYNVYNADYNPLWYRGELPGPIILVLGYDADGNLASSSVRGGNGLSIFWGINPQTKRPPAVTALRKDGLPDTGGNGSPLPQTQPNPTHNPSPNYPATSLPGSNPGPTPSPTAPAAPAPAPLLPPLPQPNLPGAPALDPDGVPRTDPAPQPQPPRPSLDPNGQPQQSGQTGGGTAGGGAAPAPGGSGLTGTGKASPLPTVDTKVVPRPGAFEGIPGAPALRPSPSPQPSRPSSPTTTTTAPTTNKDPLGLDPNGIPKILPGSTPKTQNEPNPPGGGGGACEIGSCGAANLQATQRVEGKLDTLLNGFNAGANSAQLAILNTIDAKLGPQIPGGGIGSFLLKMQSFAEKAWRTTRMDKVINALTLITVLHNGAMLSRNLAQTLGDVIGQALAIIGIKDENDSPIDINELVGKGIQDFLKDLLGEPVYTGISNAWKKANNIISTASAIIWNIRSLVDATQTILEVIGENVSRIGNALRKWGVVGGNSYGWMSENMTAPSAFRQKLDKVNLTINNSEDLASSLEAVTANVLEGQEELNQLVQNTAKLQQQLKDENPSKEIENLVRKQKEAQAKAASPGKDLSSDDLEADTDDGTP